MNVARELFKLQETDQELASVEQTYAALTARLGDDTELLDARNKLESEKQRYEEITHTQHTVEWEIEDISTKLAKFEQELYSGKTANPKELTSLQQEIDILKTKRGKLEDQALEIMETVENSTAIISGLEKDLGKIEREWQEQQEKLTAEMKELEVVISGLKEKRGSLAAQFPSQVIEVYSDLKKQRGSSVAKVDQGICRGCRISLPVNELQKVRSGDGLVRCSSCGRILFLA